jgi:hypothetical protein
MYFFGMKQKIRIQDDKDRLLFCVLLGRLDRTSDIPLSCQEVPKIRTPIREKERGHTRREMFLVVLTPT